jgi:alkylation response protein AidB-like acyl-CoA dehydrogenase
MTYSAPTAEQRFVLQHIAGLPELAAQPRFASATPDTVEAVLEGAAAFAEGEFAALSRLGDTVGAAWHDGTVTMPKGYHEAYRAFVENGWGTIGSPEAHGGQGMPFSLATAVLESLAAANVGFSLVTMLTSGAVEAIETHGSEQQKQIWLPKLIAGEWTGTMNLTEPQAGSDVGALRSIAVPVGDGTYRINGQKIFISFGEHDLAENIVHLVLARIPGAPAGTKGISLFLVPKFRLDSVGNPTIPNDVRCTSIEHKLGIHVSPTCSMSFGDNDACLGELLGAEQGGMRAMFTMMNNARINVGNQGLQVGERARQLALVYARDRVQSAAADGSLGGQPVPIIEHPDVRRMVLRMKALTQAGRALLYYAAGQVDRANLGDAAAKARLGLLTPLVKSYCSDIGCEVSSLGVQIHGGMGFIEETGAAQHYRDARIMPIYEGTNGVQAADLVGRKLMTDDGAALASLLADIRKDAGNNANLSALADAVEEISLWMRMQAHVNDRLAGSYPFQTMVAVLTSGWLMLRQADIAVKLAAEGRGDPAFLKVKCAVAAFYLEQLLPEVMGLRTAAKAGAAPLYALTTEEYFR